MTGTIFHVFDGRNPKEYINIPQKCSANVLSEVLVGLNDSRLWNQMNLPSELSFVNMNQCNLLQQFYSKQFRVLIQKNGHTLCTFQNGSSS